MRAADAATIFRMLLVAAVVYFIVVRYNALITVSLFVIATLLDAVDGYLAAWQASGYWLGFLTYAKASVGGDRLAMSRTSKYKRISAKQSSFGPRMDVAGDRFAEYAMWVTFAVVSVVPLLIVLAVIFIHSIADALMGARGTSSHMRTKFARAVYTSNASRALINILKIVTFGYLILMYIDGYPASFGYFLMYALFAFIALRGAAEIYEGAR